MTLAQIRALVRRRIREVTADQWTDAEIDTVINVALARMETLILKIAPDEFVSVYTKDLTSGDGYYEMPATTIHPLMLERRDSTSSSYRRARRVKFADILDRLANSTTAAAETDETLYARVGRKRIIVWPTPTASVSAGLRLTHVDTLTLADETDVPNLPVPLHIGIVYWSEIMLVGEGREEVKGSEAQLASLIGDIPMWYLQSGDRPDSLDIDLAKDILY